MENCEYNNLIFEFKKSIGDLKRRVLEAKQRVVDPKDENSKDSVKKNVEATDTKEFAQTKSLESLENSIRYFEHQIRETQELAPQPHEKDEEAYLFTTNNLVWSVIFGFLKNSGDSLMQCRLVSYNWKEMLDSFWRKEMQIRFSAKSDLKKFLLDFSGETTLDFGRYKFSGTNFIISDFFEILRKDLSMLTSLTLINIRVNDMVGGLSSCNINDMLGGSVVSLKKLICKVCKSTVIVIPVGSLSEIEYLDLQGCKIEYPENYSGKICSPKYVKLANISVIRPTGEKLKYFTVNNFLNVDKAQDIIIHQSPLKPKSVLTLNFAVPTQGIINSIEIIDAFISTNKFSKLKELTAAFTVRQDLSTLPESLESLSMFVRQNHDVEEPSLLPNLKYLTCCFYEVHPILAKFSRCSQLKLVHLDRIFRDVQCDLSWLPPSVETLILKNIEATFNNQNQALNIKDLILIDCPNDHSVLEILRRINSEHVYLWLQGSMTTVEKAQIVLQIYRERYYRKSFRVGSFDWRDDAEFLSNPLSQIVDKRSKNYTFENALGKADAFEREFFNTMTHIKNNSVWEKKRVLSDADTFRFLTPHFLKPHWKIKIIE